MNANVLSKVSKIINPTEEQKERMFRNIIEKRGADTSETVTRTTQTKQVWKSLMPITACLLLMLTITTIANAATGGAIVDGIKRVLFAGGGEIELSRDNAIEVNEAEIGWLVEESWGQLVLSVNGENINITDALKSDGYFYYDYHDEAEVLHRVYIVKNAGEDKTE